MPVTEKMFAFAITLTKEAYASDPSGRIYMLSDLASMSTYSDVSARIDTLKYKIKMDKLAASTNAVMDKIEKQPVPGHYMINGSHIVIKLGKVSKMPYVMKDGCYLGNKHDDAKAIMADVVANGMTYAIAYAKKTSKCGVCNTKLTDPKSIAAGIGPICAKKF
jgi:hypothetical protein